MALIIHSIVFLVCLASIAAWHGRIWREQGQVERKYKRIATRLKSFVWATNAVMYYAIQYPGEFARTTHFWTHIFPAIAAAVVFQAFVWWAVFDLAVNIAGGKPLFHMGTSAATDKPFPHYWQKAIAQAAGIAGSGALLLWADSMVML